ncbi:MAG TPA: hypothetical protein VK188_14420 [Holophaga sp.]|nr:hypothetical protein [Holophaga sp.]
MAAPTFAQHLRQTWPIAAIALGLGVYLAVVLRRGVFYTNQGNILRDREPEAFRRWVRRFVLLLALCLASLAGTFALSRW